MTTKPPRATYWLWHTHRAIRRCSARFRLSSSATARRARTAA